MSCRAVGSCRLRVLVALAIAAAILVPNMSQAEFIFAGGRYDESSVSSDDFAVLGTVSLGGASSSNSDDRKSAPGNNTPVDERQDQGLA